LRQPKGCRVTVGSEERGHLSGDCSRRSCPAALSSLHLVAVAFSRVFVVITERQQKMKKEKRKKGEGNANAREMETDSSIHNRPWVAQR